MSLGMVSEMSVNVRLDEQRAIVGLSPEQPLGFLLRALCGGCERERVGASFGRAQQRRGAFSGAT